ncbi:hypothetical protein ASPZODRAFT_1670963 [Penicilliopsis zonata CBS 506.65]|uniref:Uncharacterized protein n=1 Tax=Penicilliopsis zonata CBS 506.65 TaxID=1073090 RepID=A0A1L9S4F8_9EURO|nr:hypothetical protein ASPZODRAFT_1670963 [Penicilliopsis zonata CBS 506.65]OJJ42047.1 hypothetical protein ASPZODRAFT_1670963 [Penicilliopsis zonata CBS 506.65]
MSDPEEPVQLPSLLRNLEGLGWEEKNSTIESYLFSTPHGSHEALHFLLDILRNDNTRHVIKLAIETVFRSASLREKIRKEGNLYRNYDHAKRHEHEMKRDAPRDLAYYKKLTIASVIDHPTTPYHHSRI